MKNRLTRAHFQVFRTQVWRTLLRHRIPCPLCGSRNTSLLYKSLNVNMAVLRDIFADRVEKCEKCGFVFTNPRLSAKSLETYYSKNYYLEGLPLPTSLDEFLGKNHKEIWISKERDLRLVLDAKKGGRLLDVGCASGTLLWMAREKGFKVSGVEVGRGSADFTRTVLSLDVFCGQLEDAGFPDGGFDVVTMFHSLEHVPDPRRVLKEICRILADDGVFIAVVPNLKSWSAEKDRDRWRWLQPQNHYSHFTPESIAEMTSREGFITTISSEEGRYGEEEIQLLHGPEEVRRIQLELRGSEIILVGRKRLSASGELCSSIPRRESDKDKMALSTAR